MGWVKVAGIGILIRGLANKYPDKVPVGDVCEAS